MMKYDILVAMMLITYQNSFSQNTVIKEIIIDYETKRPIPGTSIGNRMNGTSACKDGTFEYDVLCCGSIKNGYLRSLKFLCQLTIVLNLLMFL